MTSIYLQVKTFNAYRAYISSLNLAACIVYTKPIKYEKLRILPLIPNMIYIFAVLDRNLISLKHYFFSNIFVFTTFVFLINFFACFIWPKYMYKDENITNIRFSMGIFKLFTWTNKVKSILFHQLYNCILLSFSLFDFKQRDRKRSS